MGGSFVVSKGGVRSNGSLLIVSNWEGTSSLILLPTSPVSAVQDVFFFTPPQVHDNGDDVVGDVRF